VAEKKAALAGLEALQPAQRLSSVDIRAIVDELGAMKDVLDQAERADLSEFGCGALRRGAIPGAGGRGRS